VKAITTFWLWLVNNLRRARRGIATTINSVVNRFTGEKPGGEELKKASMIHPRSLSPRQQIFYYYLTFLSSGERYGLPHRKNQTPHEYAQVITKTMNDRLDVEQSIEGSDPIRIEKDLSREGGVNQTEFIRNLSELTDGFVEARYSNHSIKPQTANVVHVAWVNIRKWFRRF
jgi:hypothetical protein